MVQKKIQKVRFSVRSMYKEKPDDSVQFLMQRYSFWIATLSILSFVFGNLVGQHGWYAVYKSVMGSGLESQIVYSGTVPPIAKVPNYVQWAKYGGDPHLHTFKQVPANALVPLPDYNPVNQVSHTQNSPIGQIYSVGYAGSYSTGGHGDGHHAGIDIRVPIATPVQSIANGIVTVAESRSGFGNTVVVKHPKVPDPQNPSEYITLYSVYAHLSSIHVRIDDIVSKGEIIGLSGNTGNSTGPHLHFQIDTDEAPFHPYWPVQNDPTLVAVNTIDPMTYVESNFKPINGTVGVSVALRATRRETSVRAVAVQRTKKTAAERLAERKAARIVAMASSSSSVRPIQTANATVIKSDTAVLGTSVKVTGTEVKQIIIDHDGYFTPNEWEEIRLELQTESGEKILHPLLPRGLYLKTAFGDAEFEKPILQAADFTNGEVYIRMRSASKRTVVIQLQPFGTLSRPMTIQR